MKFGKTLDNLMVPEWRHQYMNYNELKQMIRNAVEKAPSGSRPSNDVAIGYYRDFEELFFNSCGLELTKVNYFFAHKQAEAHRKLATLNYQLDRRPSRGSASSWSRQTENKRKLPPIKKLRLAMSEFYLSLIMLQNYQTLNMTAFRKICKKYDKNLKSEAGFAWYDKYVLRSTLAITLQLDRMISTTENMYTDYLANGDRSEAMAKLRVPPLGHPTPPVHVFSAGLFLGLFLVGAIICFISYFSVDTSPEFRYTFVSLFRGPISGVTFGFCLAINIKVYEKVGVNHVLIFEVERRNAIGAMRALEISSFFGYMCTLSILLYLLHKEFFIEDPIYIPLVQVAFVVVLFLNPFRILFYSGRIWLLTVVGRILLSPFFFVNFADFWVADQWTSLVVTIVDHYYLVRFYVRYFLDRSDAFDLSPITRWLSFDVCLRAHYTDLFESPWTWAYITICIVSSIYTVFWDLLMDFGLFRVWNGENKFLRDNLVYPRWFYYFVIVENTLLRCVWILEFALVHQELIAPYNGKSLICFSEIVRRFFWNFLRLENEHLYNCGQFRATRDIFITRLDPQEERFLESVMDNTEDLGREKLNKKYF
ncbi:GD21730 [Drosophila simulans]|uniref:GD21730 n=1 Tax=Drosophila simulans TaxID=7240 RepID=B4QAE9_DROSI|nr:GD21730 [Drosophila simulans]